VVHEKPEVAQVIVRPLALSVLLCLSASHALAQEVPAAGLAAEAGKRWEDAAAVYRRAVAEDPGRADLWARLSTIDVQLDDPATALRDMDAALALQPANAEYLRAGAVLATWQGDNVRAAGRYRALLALQPEDDEAMLGLARVAAWSGATDEAVAAYGRYLHAKADAADIWIELARAESWRGNDAAAIDALAENRTLAGDTDAYRRELAQTLARAGRPTPALALIGPLLQRQPDAADLLAARAMALARKGQVGEAHAALEALRRTHGEARDTRVASDAVRALVGSAIQPSATFYSDSDRLTVQRYAASASLNFNRGTHVSAGYERSVLDAPAASGLGRADGRTAIADERWAGVGQTVGVLTVDGRVGSTRADDRSTTPYQFGVRVRASDSVRIAADRASNLFVISPRTIELGLTSVRDRAALEWSPGLRAHLSLQAVVDQISDGNTRWEITATPRAAVARTQRINLDIGASAYLLGAAKNLSDGYYQPRRYESYDAALFPYLKISDNVGVGMSIAAGVQRDDGAAPFRFGGNASAEVTIGIYRPWVLALRGAATNNRRGETGAFHGSGGSIALTRRFL
jgi:cytochrome c-type biogenesis protein CcmH/NrfG